MIRFNENNEIIRDEEYNAIIVGLQWKGDISRSMDELEGLCEADGITVAGRVEQSLKKPDNATLIGSGKVLELAELVENMDIDTVVSMTSSAERKSEIWRMPWASESSTGRF